MSSQQPYDYQQNSGQEPQQNYTQYSPPQSYMPPPPGPGYGYGQNPYDPYGQPVPAVAPDRNGGLAIAGLVLGIISMVAWLLPICGFPVSIVGIVLAALGRRSVSRKTMATVGLVLSIIAIVLSLLNAIAGVYLRTRGY